MTANTIYELVDIALTMTTELGDGDVAGALIDIFHKVNDAYEEHTGETLNPDLIGPESRFDEEEVD